MSTRREFLSTAAAATVASRLSLHAAEPVRSGPRAELWYARPAERWLQALPLGNGNQGAMIYGGMQQERIALSDSSAWSGAPGEHEVNPEARTHLDEIRKMIFAGKYAEATKVARKYLPGRGRNFGTNLPLPDLLVQFDDMPGEGTGYRRALNLDTAVTSISFDMEGKRYKREAFATHAHRLIVYRIAHPASFQLHFAKSPLPATVQSSGNRLTMRGRAVETKHSDGKSGVDFEIHVEVIPQGGHTKATEDTVHVENCAAATVLIAIGTSFGGSNAAEICQKNLGSARTLTYPALKAAHIADYAPLFRRMTLVLGDAMHDTPTDVRRQAVAKGASDPALHALFVQYGRYLTIAGSRADSVLPLALQGIWNDGLAAAMGWTDDFHLDINTEQNYWAAEVCNLSECQQPLFRFLESLRIAGQRTAREMFGAPGWVAHTITNPWGYTAPGDIGWGNFPTAGVWISLQLWEHYRFTRDTQFLQAVAFPVLHDAAEFFLATMVTEPTHGWLVTGPSESPENGFRDPNGGVANDSMMPTIDRVMLFALFSMCERACKDLGIEPLFAERARQAKEKLPPLQIGRHGQLQEWLFDFEDAYPNHRHTSHLTSLYPEAQVDVRRTPELARAAEVTVQRRISAPDWEQTEWGRGNFMAFYARLLKGDEAVHYLNDLLTHATADNLLTFSQGGVAGAEDNIFAIDGNTAAAAAVAEMLLQSQREEIELLPALPKIWPDGEVRGLCARGGYTVDIVWQSGRLISAAVHSRFGGTVPVRYGALVKQFPLRAGATLHLRANMLQ